MGKDHQTEAAGNLEHPGGERTDEEEDENGPAHEDPPRDAVALPAAQPLGAEQLSLRIIGGKGVGVEHAGG